MTGIGLAGLILRQGTLPDKRIDGLGTHMDKHIDGLATEQQEHGKGPKEHRANASPDWSLKWPPLS